jgi:hypothetical protein
MAVDQRFCAANPAPGGGDVFGGRRDAFGGMGRPRVDVLNLVASTMLLGTGPMPARLGRENCSETPYISHSSVSVASNRIKGGSIALAEDPGET